MAIRTQFRLVQVTGSYGTTAGLINDQGAAVATGSAASADLSVVLSQMASAIKRVNGATSFTEANAGIFTHTLSSFSGNIKVGGNVIQASDGGSTITMDTNDNVTVAGKVVVGGDTSSGDAAALGYTATEGLIITGQGSTNDVTIKNDADQDVLVVATGGIDVAIAGDFDVNGGDLNVAGLNDGNANLQLKADRGDDNGDTWILSGQADQSFMAANNISGSPVAHFTITPNSTVGNSVFATGGKLKVGGNVIQASDGGATITLDDSDNVTIAGDLTVTGNDIKGSGGTAITMDGSNNVTLAADLTVTGGDIDVAGAGALNIGATVGANSLTLGGASSTVVSAGNLQVNGNINSDADESKTIFSQVTTATNTITVGNGGKVVIPGDLNVQGTTTTVDSVNLLVKDPVIAAGAGNNSANSNGGFAIISGSTTTLDMVIGRVANNTWGAGIFDTQSGSIASVAGMTLANFRATKYELDGTGDYLDVDTDLKIVSTADILLDPGGSDVLVDGNLLANVLNGTALGSATKAWSDLFLGDGSIINFHNGDMTLTHASNELQVNGGDLVIEGTNKLGLGGSPSTDYVQLDTDIKVVAAADVVIRAGGESIRFKGAGSNQFMRLERGSATAHYINFAANDGAAGPTGGSSGFGFRNNGGTMQFKNNGGSWTTFSGDEVTESKTVKAVSSTINAGTRIFGAGNGFDVSEIGSTTNARVDVFVNGQLLVSSSAVTGNGDYALNAALNGASDCDIQLQFAVENDDVVQVIVR